MSLKVFPVMSSDWNMNYSETVKDAFQGTQITKP